MAAERWRLRGRKGFAKGGKRVSGKCWKLPKWNARSRWQSTATAGRPPTGSPLDASIKLKGWQWRGCCFSDRGQSGGGSGVGVGSSSSNPPSSVQQGRYARERCGDGVGRVDSTTESSVRRSAASPAGPTRVAAGAAGVAVTKGRSAAATAAATAAAAAVASDGEAEAGLATESMSGAERSAVMPGSKGLHIGGSTGCRRKRRAETMRGCLRRRGAC